jgi:Asp-tRNA(Asn)/Glu-tRNA(Gln) amidotransferase A subunit family amidase
MIPHGTVDGAPVGLQLVAEPGADRALLDLARDFISP